MSIDNIANLWCNRFPRELSDKIIHSLAVLNLLPSRLVFYTPIMVRQTECGNYVVTLEFIVGGTKDPCYIRDLLISTSSLINMTIYKPDDVNEYFAVMEEAMDYLDMIKNRMRSSSPVL